jgi:hypothetical protein
MLIWLILWLLCGVIAASGVIVDCVKEKEVKVEDLVCFVSLVICGCFGLGLIIHILLRDNSNKVIFRWGKK